MANYLDYLRWRGDISLAKDSFNQVDAALLASVAYFPFEKIRPFPPKFTIKEGAVKFFRDPTPIHSFDVELQTMMKLLIYSPRIGNLEILDVKNRTKTRPAMQFSGITFRLNKNEIIIAYRGTDHTIVGWNEDMMMSYAPKIEGQEVAADYLTEIAEKFPNDKITLLGHSKGGNFAIYAGAFVDESIQKRIKKIYNFDGPGFADSIVTQSSFKKIIPKIRTFVPQGSVFGLMMNHPEPLTIVKSAKTLLAQHFPSNWFVVRKNFIKVDALSNSSNIIDKSIRDWLATVPPEQREDLWKSLFDALANLNITNVNQLMDNVFWGALQFSKAYMSMDKQSRDAANKILEEIINNLRSNVTTNSEELNKKRPASN